ncbi:hypothetical protein F5883DRAFT_547856 [Diaporthe sp. PMI_573]|nr:hypothetical protein F5883DRAFT_547856 [Diaporthaceae sp. PMI_573]
MRKTVATTFPPLPLLVGLSATSAMGGGFVSHWEGQRELQGEGLSVGQSIQLRVKRQGARAGSNQRGIDREAQA